METHRDIDSEPCHHGMLVNKLIFERPGILVYVNVLSWVSGLQTRPLRKVQLLIKGWVIFAGARPGISHFSEESLRSCYSFTARDVSI